MEYKRTERYCDLFFSVLKHIIEMDSGGKKGECKLNIHCCVDWHFQQQYPIVTSDAHIRIFDNLVCISDSYFSNSINCVLWQGSWSKKLFLVPLIANLYRLLSKTWREMSTWRKTDGGEKKMKTEILNFTSSSSSSGPSTLPPEWPNCQRVPLLSSFSLPLWQTQT